MEDGKSLDIPTDSLHGRKIERGNSSSNIIFYKDLNDFYARIYRNEGVQKDTLLWYWSVTLLVRYVVYISSTYVRTLSKFEWYGV